MLERLLPQPGQVLAGRYRIEAQLGMGGFGVVYKAVQLSLDRVVAIKMLLPELLANDEAVQRFQREIDLARRLQHPNTVQLLDRGVTDEGLHFLVMEFLAGRDLETVLDTEGPMAPARVQDIVSQVLGSLGEAHERGVIHRDLKPPNIMILEAFGRPDFAKVLDFGIARAIESGESTSALVTRGIIGTPHYMSPEQAQGRRDLDGRCDLYSLGVMMVEMLTGTRPYDGGSALEVLVGHARPEPVPIPEPVLHGPLGPIVARALAKDRHQRYPTAGDMLRDLRAVDLRPGTPLSLAAPYPPGTPQPMGRPLPLITPQPLPQGARSGSTAVLPPTSRRLAWVLLLVVAGLGIALVLWLTQRGGPSGDSELGLLGDGSGGGIAAGTGTPAPVDTALADGTYAFRDISLTLRPAAPTPLGLVPSGSPTAGAPWFEVRLESGRPVEIAERSAYDEVVTHMALAWDDAGRLSAVDSSTPQGYLLGRLVLRWVDEHTVELQQQGRNHGWDGFACPWQRLRLDEAGRPAERVCLDLDGVEVAQWDGASRMVVETRDERGFPTRVAFRDGAGAATPSGCLLARERADTGPDCSSRREADLRCHALALESTATGQLLRQSCLDAGGNALSDAPSVRAWERDNLGNILVFRLLDPAGRPQLGDEGWSEMRQRFAPQGGSEQACWFDRAGRPIARGVEDQVACLRFAYDARGHIVRESAFDNSDAPTTFWPLGVHRIEYARDAWGSATETRYYGVDQRLAGRSPDGVAIQRCQHHELGLEADCSIFDAADSPMLTDGHARVTMAYDERGNLLHRCHFDAQGRPATAPQSGQGAVCLGFEYDEQNRVTSVRYLDADLDPARTPGELIHRTDYRYDDAGRVVERLYRDERSRPMGRFGLVCGVAEERDGLGRLVRETNLDCQGRPYRDPTTGASTTYTFDERGRSTSLCHLDLDGAPYPLRTFPNGSYPFAAGAACQRYEWDDQNRLSWLSFEDGAGGSTRGRGMNGTAVAHIRVEYDGLGRQRRNYLYRDTRQQAPVAVVDCLTSRDCLVLEWFVPF